MTAGHAPTTDQMRTAWDRVAPGFDEYVTAASIGFADGPLDRAGVGPDMAFLDVAAGTGALAIPAARRGAEVVATDLSPVMIDRLAARARDEGLDNLDARVMDGTALDLDDDSFDVSASQNGVSLFADLEAGLAELVRVTRPGGRVLLVAFGPPRSAEFLTFFLGALKAAVPGFTGPPRDPPPLPFQLADPAAMAARLAAAGLRDVEVDTTAWELAFESADHLWKLVVSNPIGAQLAGGLTEAQRSEARQVLDGMLRERSGGGPGAVLHTALNLAVGTAR